MMSICFATTHYFTIKLNKGTFHYQLRMSKLLTWFSCRQAISTSNARIITFSYNKNWSGQSMLSLPSVPAGTRDEPLRTSAWEGSQCFVIIINRLPLIDWYQKSMTNPWEKILLLNPRLLFCWLSSFTYPLFTSWINFLDDLSIRSITLRAEASLLPSQGMKSITLRCTIFYR